MSLRAGKLPAAILGDLLSTLSRRDPRVRVGPGIGRDAAVIDIGGGRVLVATMDPVTFASEDIGWYAVNVNANDIACMGARPAWFLATALLPVGGDDQLPAQIFRQIDDACSRLNIELVGGHTEVTPGIDRPIIAGAMLGEAAASEIIGQDQLQAGDAILLSGAIAIEGTALLAREAQDALRGNGVSHAILARAKAMLHDPGISVVGQAQALCEQMRPRMLHDPTEGGLSTALYEMAEAGACTLRIDPEAIVVLEETRAVCDALGLDPLGLLASGALLAIVSGDEAARLAGEAAGTAPGRAIGRVEEGAARVIMGASDSTTPLPVFARDELARYFDEARRQTADAITDLEG